MSPVRYRRAPLAIWRASSTFLVAAVPPSPPTRVAGSAARVWAALADAVTLDELAVALAAATGAPITQVHADVQALVERLVPLGLVEVVA